MRKAASLLLMIGVASAQVNERELEGKPFLKYRVGTYYVDSKEEACARLSPGLTFKRASEDADGFVVCTFEAEENKRKVARELGGVKHVLRCPEHSVEQSRNNSTALSAQFCLCSERFIASGTGCIAVPDAASKAAPQPSAGSEQVTLAVFRGTTPTRRVEVTRGAGADLGAGVYYTASAPSARSHAQARYLETWKPGAQTVKAIVLTAQLQVPKSLVLDFSSGPERESFETYVRGLPNGKLAAQLLTGLEVSSVKFQDAVAGWLKQTKRSLSAFPVVIAPDYRFNEAQLRVSPEIATRLDGIAKVVEEVGAPTAPEIRAAFDGPNPDLAPQSTKVCAPESKAGSCANWSDRAGRALFQRRGWQSTVYEARAKTGGDHKHLRVGALIVDGTFLQFDLDARNGDKGELFVGDKSALIARLGAIKRPFQGSSGAEMFSLFWDGQPKAKYERLVFSETGVATWAP